MADREFSRASITAASAAAIGLMIGASGIVHGSTSVFIVPLTKTFGWTRTEFMTALSFWSWTQAAVFLATGWLMDRFGVRAIALPGILVLVATLAALSRQNGSLTMLYAFYTLIGLCSALGGNIGYYKVVSGWFHRRRGFVLGLVAVAYGLSGALIPQWLTLAINHVGWSAGYLCLAAYVIVLGIPVTLMLREAPAVIAARAGKISADAAKDSYGLSGPAAVRTAAFWFCLAVYLLSTAQAGLNLNLAALAIDRHLSSAQAATVVSAMTVGAVLSNLAAAFLLDRWQSAKVGLPYAGAVLIGLLLLQNGTSYPTVLVGGLLIGAGYTGEQSIMPYFLTRFFGLRAYGFLYSLLWCSSAVALGLGWIVTGAIYDHTGSYHLDILYCGCTNLLIAVCFFTMPKYRFSVQSPPAEEVGEAAIEAP